MTQVTSNVSVLAVEQGDIANTQAYINELDTMMANLTLDVRNWQAKVDAKQVEIDAKIVEIEQKQVQINNTQIELDNAELKEVQYYNEMKFQHISIC